MAKLVIIESVDSFDKIKTYTHDYLMRQFYITPKLMKEILDSMYINCAIGLDLKDIKMNARPKIDLVCKEVFNKVFQRNVYRVDAIKIGEVLYKLADNSFFEEEFVFDISTEKEDSCYLCDYYSCSDYIKL